jgi:AcrR family transcriptional regulator
LQPTIHDTTAIRPLRADARRNRDRLLAIARRAFVDNGVDASLDDIARTAGVGIGTLYRHFPSREALIEALIGDDIARLAELGDELVSADAPDGVERWLAALITHGITFRGLAETLTARHTDGTSLGDLCDRMHAAGATVVWHAQARGWIRHDVDPVDPVDLATSIAWITEADADDRRRNRLLEIGLAGLRPLP